MKVLLQCFGVWLVLQASCSSLACAGESYYMVVFAQQRVPNWFRFVHSFATFVKVSHDGPQPDSWPIEVHTLSWLPADLQYIPTQIGPRAGRNLDLPSTLDLAMARKTRVSAWGPYQIDKELYDRALAKFTLLEQGAVGYKVLDGLYRPDRGSNCLHIVTDLDTSRGIIKTWLAHGDEASRGAVCHLRPWIVDPWRTHDWLRSRLGLDAYPICYRTMD